MATSRLISDNLRRSQFSLLRPLQSLPLLTPSLHPSKSPPSPTTSDFTRTPFFVYTTPFRQFSSLPSDSGFTHELNSVTESELRSLGFNDGSLISGAGGSLLEDPILPIRAVISLLDGYHDFTGLPWWIIIASSTVALRIVMFPWILLQIQKLKKIAELFPKLPPPFPPPLSGRSFVDQLSLFRRKKRALGCPSYLWFLASFSVQIPCFFVSMASIRRMSLGHHPGFDTGGILWFQNLTELPNGVLGPIFPLLVATLHFCNIQVSFRSSSIGEQSGLFHLLVKFYRKYLELLTLPLLFIGFCIPQGSLVYWATNSSLTLIQQLILQHPAIRQKLGLHDKEVARVTKDPERDLNGPRLPDAPGKQRHISAFTLSPRELVDLSISYLAKGNKDRAIPLLRLALDKDPECYRALTVMGQTMVQEGLYDDATEYLDRAVSKISLLGQPTDAETVDFLIQASLLAGAAYYRQGKLAEALAHFKRVRDMEEPEDPTVKSRYFEGLVVLASVLSNEGRKKEAARYLRMAVAYDPQYSIYLQKLENDTDDFVDDLVSSRRGDY